MKKLTSLLVMTLLSASQALKVSESTGDQAKMGQKLEIIPGQSAIQSISSEITNIGNLIAPINQMSDGISQAENQAGTSLTAAQQNINTLASSIASLGSQLVNLNNSISSAVSTLANVGNNAAQVAAYNGQIAGNLSGLGTDITNVLNGNSNSLNVLTTPGLCWSGAAGQQVAGIYSLASAISSFNQNAKGAGSIACWEKARGVLRIQQAPTTVYGGTVFGTTIYSYPGNGQFLYSTAYTLLSVATGGSITQTS